MSLNFNVERKKLQVGPATIYYEVTGTGRPLLLLHGLSGSTRWWRYNVGPLAEHFEVYALDLIGFGRGRGQQFQLREAAGILLRWMNIVGIGQARIAGHSMGGYITLELAQQAPERLERMALVDALALPVGKNLIQNGLALVQAMRYMPANFLPVLFADALRAGPGTLRRALGEVMAADLSGRLEEIDIPALVVWGEYDQVLPPAMGQSLAELLPQARLEVIPGAGHNPMWDRPQEFNHLILDFLLKDQLQRERSRARAGQ